MSFTLGCAAATGTEGPGPGTSPHPDGLFVDAHTHCSAAGSLDPGDLDLDAVLRDPSLLDPALARLRSSCVPLAWDAVDRSVGPASVVLLSNAYLAAAHGTRIGGEGAIHRRDVRDLVARIGRAMNERFQVAASRSPRASFFAALDCLYDTPFDEPGWVEACKADADRWIAAGARGFKDYVGGTWLDDWNLYNGFCGRASDCMTEASVRYLALEPKWREVVAYVTEARRMPVLTHITYNEFEGKPCYDPTTGARAACGPVTIGHLLDLADWARRNLSERARRRIVVAHLGHTLPSRHDRVSALDEFLGAGLSSDISAELPGLVASPCLARQILARHPRQILFGTDERVEEDIEGTLGTYRAYLHLLQGPWQEFHTFRTGTSAGTIAVPGLGLATPVVPSCDASLPGGLRELVLRDNHLALYD